MKIDNEELQAVRTATLRPSTASAVSATADHLAERYVAIEGTYRVIPSERLRTAGWKITKGMRPMTQAVPDIWVDKETGEILTKAEARKQRIRLPGVRSNSDKALTLCERLADCSPSERPFAGYLLRLRNRRGGLVAPLDTILDLWIARECNDIRSTNKARKRKQLRSIIERRKLMINDVTMAKDLQILNPNITKQDILEEGAKLYAI